MGNRTGAFAIVLDRWEGEHPDHWPLTALFDTLSEAREAGSYRGDNPSPVPHSAVAAHRLESTRLLNERTGQVEPGAIYRLEEKTGG